jgi:arylsulfatase A-like enzyme
LQENTIVLLIGDHGYHLGEHGWWNKNTRYELSCRAPLIVSVPGNENAGSACPAIVEFVDIYPTLTDLCNLELPPKLHGRSLRSLLDNPRGPGRTAAFSWYCDGISVRTSRWRYTAWKDGLRELSWFDPLTGEYYDGGERVFPEESPNAFLGVRRHAKITGPMAIAILKEIQ